jgi:ABC-2 type transport system permease protein
MSAAMSATSITTTTGTVVGAPPSRAVAAEWSKLGGSRGTCLAYVLLGVLTVILSGMVAAGTSTEPAGSFGDDDLIVNSLGGLLVGIVVAVVIGAITLGGEYGSGMISATFAATPRRHRAIAAKAFVTWVAVTIVGIVAAFASYFVARPILRGNGYVAPGYPDPDLTSAPVLRAIVGTGVLIGLYAVLAVGVAAIVRRTAAAIPITIALIIVPAMVAVDDNIAKALQRWTPLAGFAIQQTVDRPDYYVRPLPGLAVTAAYAIAAVALGIIVTNRRDVTA